MKYMAILSMMVALSGCGTTNAGLTSTSVDRDYKTTVVFGFAVIREKIDSRKDMADVTYFSSLGLIYDSKINTLGVGYLSSMYSRIFDPDRAEILLEVEKRDGELRIKVENVEQKQRGEE
jgi:hypothetical protein